jgi:hypothetical protein
MRKLAAAIACGESDVLFCLTVWFNSSKSISLSLLTMFLSKEPASKGWASNVDSLQVGLLLLEC